MALLKIITFSAVASALPEDAVQLLQSSTISANGEISNLGVDVAEFEEEADFPIPGKRNKLLIDFEWGDVSEREWFELDCNPIIRGIGGFTDAHQKAGGVCLKWNPTAENGKMLVYPAMRRDCETSISYFSYGAMNYQFGKPPVNPGYKVVNVEWQKWCPGPNLQVGHDKCKETPQNVEWAPYRLGYCWNNRVDANSDSVPETEWHWTAGKGPLGDSEAGCVKDRPIRQTGEPWEWNTFFHSDNVWCPSPQCLSNTYQNKNGLKGWLQNYLYKSGSAKYFMCRSGKIPSDTPDEFCTDNLHETLIQYCPVESQVPFKPVAQDLLRSWPLDGASIATGYHVYNQTLYTGKLPAVGSHENLLMTDQNWDEFDCEEFFSGRNRMNDDLIDSYGGACVSTVNDKDKNRKEFLLVLGLMRTECDYGIDVIRGDIASGDNLKINNQGDYYHQTKWCPACHFANDPAVCDNAPTDRVGTRDWGWCWSDRARLGSSSVANDWAFRFYEWKECTKWENIQLGWVFCSTPSSHSYYYPQHQNFKCTPEYAAKGFCDMSKGNKYFTQYNSNLLEDSSVIWPWPSAADMVTNERSATSCRKWTKENGWSEPTTTTTTTTTPSCETTPPLVFSSVSGDLDSRGGLRFPNVKAGLDLIMRTTEQGAYTSADSTFNGLVGSDFARINVKCGTGVVVEAITVKTGTMEPVSQEHIAFTLYDMDEGKRGKGRVSLQSCSTDAASFPSDTELSAFEANGCILIGSCKQGKKKNDPTSLGGLTADHTKRSVSLFWSNTARITFKLSVGAGTGGRNFQFAFAPTNACLPGVDNSFRPAECCPTGACQNSIDFVEPSR